MFTGIKNLIEEAALLVEDKGYKLTHPFTWTGYSSTEEDLNLDRYLETITENPNVQEDGELEIPEREFPKFQIGNFKSAINGAKNNRRSTNLDGLEIPEEAKIFLEAVGNPELTDSVIRLFDKNLPDDEAQAIAESLKDMELSFKFSDIMKMMYAQDLEDDKNIPPQAKNTTNKTTKTATKRGSKTSASKTQKEASTVNLKDAIESTPLGKKLFDEVEPVLAN